MAPRLLLGLVRAQVAAVLPVYIVLVVLAGIFRLGQARMWVTLAAVLGLSAWLAWAVRARRPQVEATLARGQGALAAAWARLAALLPGALRPVFSHFGPPGSKLGWAAFWAGVRGRIRLPAVKVRLPGAAAVNRRLGRWSWPSLAELSAEMTIPLAVGAVGVTLFVQQFVAVLAVELSALVLTVVKYALIVIAAILVLTLAVRYLRSR
jgi:hypothetical protein